MTNEEKARELGQKYQTPCHGIGDCEFEAYIAAKEMAEWKDKIFDKTIDSIIEKFNKYPDNAVFGKSNMIDMLIEIKKLVK